MQRVIMHIDFNSYFASCEQQDTIAWRGRPLGVCEHLGGIIIAPSIEAKRWGVKTGMPVWEARKICPHIVLTKTRPGAYRMYTKRFLKVLAEYTDAIEKYSIDEAFLDLTLACNIRIKAVEGCGNTGDAWVLADPFIEAVRIAQEIKRRITSEVGDYLTCSVGIAWNKLVAKIASDMQKPDGLVVVRPQDKEWLYTKLKLTDIPGIGKRQALHLRHLGILSLTDLRNYPVSRLVSYFGIMGYHLYRIGQLEGSWKELFDTAEPMKSIGHVYTIAREYRDRKDVGEQVLYKLCEMVGVRLRSHQLSGNIVHVHVWDGDRYMSKTKKLGSTIDDGRDIFLECRAIVKELWGTVCGKVVWPVRIRQVGVTVSGLEPTFHQLSLFPFDEKKRRVVAAMDKINRKYEDPEIVLGRQTSKLGDAHEGVARGLVVGRVPAYLARSVIRDSIGFGRMKEF